MPGNVAPMYGNQPLKIYNNIFKAAKNIRPSRRGELGIADVNRWYMEQGELPI